MNDDLPLRRKMWGNAEIASCREVGRALQAYLDGHTDPATTSRIARHLERCRRCGMEADAYTAIKRALGSRDTGADATAVARLRAFGRRLADEPPPTATQA